MEFALHDLVIMLSFWSLCSMEKTAGALFTLGSKKQREYWSGASRAKRQNNSQKFVSLKSNKHNTTVSVIIPFTKTFWINLKCMAAILAELTLWYWHCLDVAVIEF